MNILCCKQCERINLHITHCYLYMGIPFVTPALFVGPIAIDSTVRALIKRHMEESSRSPNGAKEHTHLLFIETILYTKHATVSWSQHAFTCHIMMNKIILENN